MDPKSIMFAVLSDLPHLLDLPISDMRAPFRNGPWVFRDRSGAIEAAYWREKSMSIVPAVTLAA